MRRLILVVFAIAAAVGATTPASAHPAHHAGDYCPHWQTQLIYEETDLDQDLYQSITLGEYRGRVAMLRRIYGRIVVDDLSHDCLVNAAVPAEKALNHFSAALRVWDGCGIRKCSKKKNRWLQAEWAAAHKQVRLAAKHVKR